MRGRRFHEPVRAGHGYPDALPKGKSGRLPESPAASSRGDRTVLSVEEQLSGWYTEVRQAKKADRLVNAYKRLAACVRFLADLQILDFTEAASQRYQDLLKLKLKIGRTDLRIAATALEHEALVVTRNTQDFKQVPGLTIEDWSQ
jgi:tRNA(fMet)-specific endonuclease VapC